MNDDVFSSSVDEVLSLAEDEASSSVEDEAPAAGKDEVSSAREDEVPPLAEDEAPAAAEDEVPPLAEDEVPPPVEDEVPPPAEDEVPAVVEDEVLPPAEDEASSDSAGGGGGSAAVDLDSALGSLTAFLDTREQLSNPELELMGIETFALSPIESSPGLKGVLLEILGPYDNIVTQYKYQQSNNSYYTYVNEVTPDYPWICSAVLFILLLVSVFRFIGRCFSWMK